jgi:hypothetical protein
MKAPKIRSVAPLMRLALKSFRRARTAITEGHVNEMIGCLTRGMGCLDVINGSRGPRR